MAHDPQTPIDSSHTAGRFGQFRFSLRWLMAFTFGVAVGCTALLRQGRSAWLLLPAAISLGVFAWLLSLHPTAAGRVYSAYGGVYVSVALAWLWLVDGVRPQAADFVGAAICLAGMAVIMFAPRGWKSPFQTGPMAGEFAISGGCLLR